MCFMHCTISFIGLETRNTAIHLPPTEHGFISGARFYLQVSRPKTVGPDVPGAGLVTGAGFVSGVITGFG